MPEARLDLAQGDAELLGELGISCLGLNGGPMFKRLMPRARGMAYLVRRRSSHIAIGLEDYSKLED